MRENMPAPPESLDRELEAKKRIEALLFSSGRKMTAAELARLARESEEIVKKQLSILKEEYDKTNSSMMIIQDGDLYYMNVREKYLSYVKKIVPRTEMNKTVMETLAVIAWKAPILQSDIIRIRTNKAYDHIDQLEESGFISKKRHSRSYMITLTQKFYSYFDLSGGDSDLRKSFKKIEELAEKSKNSPFAKMVNTLEVYSKEAANKDPAASPEDAEEGPIEKKPPVTLLIHAHEFKSTEEVKNKEGKEEAETPLPEKEEDRKERIMESVLSAGNALTEESEKIEKSVLEIAALKADEENKEKKKNQKKNISSEEA